MQIGVAYADAEKQIWLNIDVPPESTIQTAIELSGVLDKFPHIDLQTHKVGIFGKIKKLDTPLQEGDRVEIYRPIIADPKTVKRRDRDTED